MSKRNSLTLVKVVKTDLFSTIAVGKRLHCTTELNSKYSKDKWGSIDKEQSEGGQ